MSATTGMTEMIRIRIEPEKKAALTRLYQSAGDAHLAGGA